MMTPSQRDTNAPIKDNIFFVATTKLEKITQLNALAEMNRWPAIFLPITALGKPAESPEEEEKSFADNMMVKCHAASRFLNGFTREQADAALRSLGFSEERIRNAQLYGCAEDSGISFEFDKDRFPRNGNGNGNGHSNGYRNGTGLKPHQTDFVDIFLDTSDNGPYASDADKEIIEGLKRFRFPDKPFPGAETVRVFGAAGGVENLFRLVNLAIAKAGLSFDPRATKDARDWLRFYEQSTIGVFRWTPGKTISAFDLGEAVKTHPEQLRVVYDGSKTNPHEEATTYSYTVPTASAKKSKFTTRDSLGMEHKPLSRAKALNGVMKKLDIRRLKKPQWDYFLRNNVFNLSQRLSENPYTVGLAPDDGSYLQQKRRERLVARCEEANMHFGIEAGTETDSGQLTTRREDLHHMQRLIDSNDAFVLMPDPNDQLDPSRQLEKFLFLTYLAIHKQLDPHGKGKTIILFDDGHTGCWDQPYQQILRLFNRGVYGDRPSESFYRAYSEDDVIYELNKARSEYRRVEVEPAGNGPVPEVKDDMGTYNVCVWLSASLEGTYEDKAKHIGHRIQQEGMGMVWGAGNRNMMGGLYDGAVQHYEETGKIKIAGSSTHNIIVQETDEGRKPDMIPDPWYYEAPSIAKRKEFFIKNSHAFVCLEGGIGTLDELLTYMWYKENKPELVEHKPLILSESAYAQNPVFEHVINLYLGKPYAELTEEEREQKGIIIMEAPKHKGANDPGKLYEAEMEAVMKILKEHRARYHSHLAPEPSAQRDQNRGERCI